MKIKDFIVPAALVVVSTWFAQSLVNHYLDKKETEAPVEVKAGQSFVVPKKEQLIKPLMTEVDFLEADTPCKDKAITVSTARLQAQFSHCGAAITELTSKKLTGVEEKPLTFIDAQPYSERERLAFLLAFEEKTPLNYELVSQAQDKGIHTIRFRATAATAVIEKEFRLYDDSYKLDITISVEPKTPAGVQPRLLVPAPYLAMERTTDIVQGVFVNDDRVLEKKKPEDLEGRLWVMPTLFGAEDRYFVSCLVNDKNHFVQRAYYSPQGTHQLIALLEGPTVTQKSSWELSFYCGPKQIAEMDKVDTRLEATLDYGWLGPISKFSMVVLNFLYHYIHNYGIAIMILTLLIKLLLVPFTFRAEKSAKKAAETKKKLQYLEQKYKHDPETLAREKAELIRKGGLFDVGCLAMFAQLPILVGLNRALSTSIELYHAPFFGWIKDLSAIDPYYILPALTALGIFVHSGTANDPRQRMVTLFMALVVGGVMINFAAGLVLFIGMSTWLSIAQTRIQKALKV